MSKFRSVALTGASSGIGAAIARRLARQPGIRLALNGRDEGRLADVAGECRRLGATVETLIADVTDRRAMSEWARTIDAGSPVDLVIAAAGINSERGLPGDAADRAIAVVEVNVVGCLNTVEPFLPAMRQRRGGQIGILASVAGFRGMPRTPSYGASKAALINLGQAWREALAASGVGVSVICPGYVRTPMTAANRIPMPFMIDADDAAARSLAAVERNRGCVSFPWPLAVAAWLFRTMPASVTRPLVPKPERPQP